MTLAQAWWQEALPVGNGKLGATVFGGITSETIQFNEDTIWTGQPHYSDNTNSTPAHLASIRTTCNSAAGGNPLTEATTYIMSLPPREASYEDAGSIALTVPVTGGTSNYLRSLDLRTATVNVHYDNAGVTYNRDIFASAPSNKVIAVHFTASQSGKINFTVNLTTQQGGTFSVVGNDVVMHTHVTGPSETAYTGAGLTNGIWYDARVRVVATGGTVTPGATSITVANADDATLYLAVVSNYKDYKTLDFVNYPIDCSNNVANAQALGYTTLRSAQQTDYQNLFNRVVLDLGSSTRTNKTTGFRKVNAVDGTDPQLVTLDFQLGRYLMISASRPGSQAMNLQGKWNPLIDLSGQWDSKMTLNINEEEEYWGAEVCNLSECALPLMDLVTDLSVTGHRAAGTNYFCDGWVAHHNTDLWRDASAINGNDGIWPTGGAWLCQHVWWHYLFTGDTNWLATVGYPAIKGSAQFFQGFLVTSFNGYKVTNPSYSPEHNPPGGGPNVCGPTMDNELVRDVLTHAIAAAQVLGVDASLQTAWTTLLGQLPPDRVGASGQLEEWLGVDEGNYDSGHRHCSHLVGFFPGDQISLYYTPTNASGAAVSTSWRGWGNSGITPWGCAVRANLRTRLQDGNGAMTNLFFLYGYNKTSTNLIYGDNHDQVDSVFGRLSAIANMFLQSPNGDVILLPALPTLFTNGMVSGLCAAGGFEVDNMTWTNGALTGATILSKLGNTCNLRSRWPIDVMLGSTNISAPMIAPGLYQFPTITGSNYTIVPAKLTEVESTAMLSSSGDTQTVVTNAVFSNWRGTMYSANAASDYVSYGVSNVTAGTYRIRVVADENNNRGQFQLSVGPIGGPLVNQGSVQDTYSATNLFYLVSSRFNRTAAGTPVGVGPTNAAVLWTNQLTELDCGTWTAPSSGDYEFKFTIPGKNASSTGYALALDLIKLTPSVPAGPPDQPPTDIALDNSSVAENQPSGTAVGNFSTTDPDTGETFTYALVSGTGSTGNGSFTISGSNLLTSAAFNYEAQNSYSIRVRTTDSGSQSFDKVFTVTVVNANDAPTDIALDNASVAENQPSGTSVGNLSTTDQDAGDTFTYTLVSGTGSADNGSFSISGSNLLTSASFDYETQSSYSVRVRTTDAGGLFTEKAFTINVQNVNETPTDIGLSGNTVQEGRSSGTAVGTLSTSDPDGVGSFAYTLVSGTGSDDNGSFNIVGNALQTAAVFNYNVQNSYSIRVRTTDAGSLFYEKIFTINVTSNTPPAMPVNVAPADASLDVSLTPTLTASVFSDVDAGDTHAASEWLIQDTNSTVIFDSGVDPVNKTSLTVPGGTLDFATPYNWQVRYEDSRGAWSAYSALTTFTTLRPTLSVFAGGGQMVVWWPAPAAGFSLVSSTEVTNLMPNWTLVSPAPTTWGGMNWVTNPVSPGATFYRLVK